MRRAFVWLMMLSLLAACGTGGSDTEKPTAAADANAAAATTDPVATATPDNAVQTAEASALNTSFATAQPLDGEVRTTIKESTFYYSLNVPAGGVVSATLAVDSGSPESATFTLYDKNQAYVKNEAVAVGENATLSYIFNEPGTVFLEIRGNSSIVLNGSATAQDDAASGKDAPSDDDFSKALEIKQGEISGMVGDEDRNDLYLLEIPAGGARWQVEIAPTGSSTVKATLYNKDQGYLQDLDGLPTEIASMSELIPVEFTGRWFLRVHGEGAYTITNTLIEQNDGDQAADASNDDDFTKATKVELGTIKGELGDDDVIDLYAFELPKTGLVLTVTLQAEGDASVTTYNNDQAYINDVKSNAGASESVMRIVPVEQGGRWYLRVHGEGQYTVTVEAVDQQDGGVTGDAPEELNNAVTASSNSFTGYLGNDDSYDMLHIPASLGRSITITVLDGDDAIDIQLYTVTENYLKDGTATKLAAATLVEDSGDSGDYVIRLHSNDPVHYRVEISQ